MTYSAANDRLSTGVRSYKNPMTLFIVSVALVLLVSALCSLTEAALYSVRRAYVRQLAASGSRAGKILLHFKENMEQPITAILIINTAANTAGAAVAGAQAAKLFGDQTPFGIPAVVLFSVLFTIAVLLFSEIMPKVAGVSYGTTIARLASIPLAAVIRALKPLVWAVQSVSKVVRRRSPVPQAPEEEVRQIALLSAEEGSILPLEAKLVRNVLALNEVRARDIMTPRTVVFSLAAGTPVAEVGEQIMAVPYTRIPIWDEDPENWTGIVLKHDILACLARDEFDTRLESIKKPLGFVPEGALGHRLLHTFIQGRRHLLAVVDEYGGILGVVSLEDVMESLIGAEIVDETDLFADMQQVARRRGALRLKGGLGRAED